MISAFLETLKDSMRRVSFRHNFFLIGTLFIVLGIGTLLWGAYQYAQASQSAQWPATDGSVTYADASNRKTFRYRTLIRNRFAYSYSVNGTMRTGHRIFYAENALDFPAIEKYPIGSRVRVFYDPRSPEVAVLEPGIRTKNYFVFLSGILIMIFGFLMQKGYLWLVRTGKC